MAGYFVFLLKLLSLRMIFSQLVLNIVLVLHRAYIMFFCTRFILHVQPLLRVSFSFPFLTTASYSRSLPFSPSIEEWVFSTFLVRLDIECEPLSLNQKWMSLILYKVDQRKFTTNSSVVRSLSLHNYRVTEIQCVKI